MPTIKDVSAPKLNILAYGPPMSGKTRFAASMRKVFKGQWYIFNFDSKDNLLPLVLDPSMHDVEFDQYGIGDQDRFLNKIVSLKKSCPYEVVMLDNGNNMHQMLLKAITRNAGREEAPQIQDWGLSFERAKARIKDLVDLPCHVYMTFHQQIEKDEITGRVIGRILVSGKHLPDEIPPMFNLFLRFEVKNKPSGEPDYMVRCAGDTIFPAGDKTGSLSYCEPPDFEKMWEKINKAIGQKGDKK